MADENVLATVLASTLQKSRRKLIMASLQSNALMAWAFANDRVDLETGGKDITNPITLGRNPNVSSYRYYDELPVAQTSEFDDVKYNFSRVAGSVIISDQEQDENEGETAVFKLMTAKMEVLEESIKEKFSDYLYGSGAGADPNGLSNLIPDDPTTGTLGDISRATETQWRTSVYDFAGSLDASNIEEAFDDILMDLKLKGDKPDLILAGRNVIRSYRQAVRDKVTLNLSESKNGSKMFDLGFEGISHNGITILYDEDCPVDKCYFINSKYLRTHIMKKRNFSVKDLVAPWTVDAVGKRSVWMGQMCLWRAYRTHAVLLNSSS